MQDGGLKLDRVLVSPLTRTIQTAALAMSGAKGRHKMCTPLAAELCRERYGKFPCDKRHPRSFLQQKYKDVDFAMMEDDEDKLWTANHHETDEEINARAARFLEWVWQHVNEKQILVSTHSHFILALYAALGLDGAPRPGNADLIPLVLSRRRSSKSGEGSAAAA